VPQAETSPIIGQVGKLLKSLMIIFTSLHLHVHPQHQFGTAIQSSTTCTDKMKVKTSKRILVANIK